MIGTIYKIVSKIDRTKIYVGSTWNFTRRKSEHKSDCYNKNSKKYNTTLYKYIRENGGWNEFELSIIECKNYDSSRERTIAEQYYINLYGGIENLLNGQDAVENKDQRIEKINIARAKCFQRNIDTKRFYCEPCNTTCRTNWDLQKHIQTNKHQLKIMESINIIKLPTYCESCDQHCPSHAALLVHYKSNKHENNLEQSI